MKEKANNHRDSSFVRGIKFVSNNWPVFLFLTSIQTVALSGSGEWYIQLGAMHSTEYAEIFARSLQNSYSELSGSIFVHSTTEQANKKNWNFVRVGPFADYENTLSQCEQFQSIGLDCFPVKSEATELISYKF